MGSAGVSRVYAEAQTTAALRALIARATEPALAELEALRVAVDVRGEALKAALVGTECIDPASLREVIDRLAHAAREEADAAAQAARSQALEEAQVRQELERAEAEKRLALAQAQAEAEREADRLEHAALTEALEQARDQVDAIRVHAEAQLESARAAQTQLLEEAHAQLGEAHAETERAVAARLGESETMRAQLEETRAEVQRAHAETDRVEQAAQVRLEIARAEFETQKELEAAGRAVLTNALEEARAEVDAARLMPGGANPPDEILDQLSTTFRTLDEAANLTQALDALLDGLGAVFPRAALFVVKSQSQRLQGWRSVGFTGVAAITKEVEFSLATDSALTRAVTTGRVIITEDGRAPDREPAAGAGGPWTVTLPVAIGDRVVAVVHADGGERSGDSAPSFDRGTALKVSDMLVRHAGRRLAALTASTPVAIDAPAERARQEEPVRHEDARRYAHLLVSEIKRYKQATVLGGLPDSNLHERLKGEIERCRSLYARRVPPEVDATFNFFDQALCGILGGGDVDVRG
jgi:hypothetical protein